MQAQVEEQWLRDTRAFWDTDSAFDAKYRRICSDPEIDACADERELEQLWRERTSTELAQLLDGIPLRPDWTCLEIGCGVGRLLEPIAARCAKVIGVDLSPKMVEFAREYLRDVPNVEVHLNDGQSLAMIADSSVDWVFSHLAFQHITVVEVVERYIAQIARVLRPGGYVRIQNWREAPTPAIQKLKNMVRAALGRELYRGSRGWLWSPGKRVQFGGVAYQPRVWRKLLESHGLAVTSMQIGVGHEYWMWTTCRNIR